MVRPNAAKASFLFFSVFPCLMKCSSSNFVKWATIKQTVPFYVKLCYT